MGLKLSKEEIEKIVKESRNIADFCRRIGWEPVGGNYRMFHNYVKKYNLDISHFTGCRTNIGNVLNRERETKMKNYENVQRLVKGPRLLKKLLEEGIKERKCECCGNTIWNGQPIPLQVHHVDGNCLNNNVDNLKILCPNCHALTDNFAGKKNKKEPKKLYCKECGKEITRYSKSGLCLACLNRKNGTSKITTKEDFIESLIVCKTFSSMAKKYGCSTANITKWAKKFGLPTKSKDIKDFLKNL